MSGVLALYYLGLAVCSFSNKFTGVRYSRGTKGAFSLALSSCVTCVIASLFFLTLTGFKPVFNLVTVWYALGFAAICLVSQYTGFSVYRYTDVAGSGMVTSGISLLLNCALGTFVFRETFTVFTAIRILCMLGSGVAVFLHNRKYSTGRWTVLGWVILVIMLVNGVGSTFITKLYAMDTRVVDNSSYCLLVNLFCLTASLTTALVLKRGNISACIEELRTIRPKHYLYIAWNTISGNVTSLLTLAILAQGDLLLHTPLSGAIGVLSTQLVAIVFEKERFMPIPTLLSLVAVVLSFWG